MYYLVSDLHGMNPSDLSNILVNEGFKKEVDTLVVAGDITYGKGFDNQLVKYLRDLPNKILIKGNHDYGHGDFYDNSAEKNLRNHNLIVEKDVINFVRNLPYQMDTPEFHLAHGLYVTDRMKKEFNDIEQEHISVWASPHLLDKRYEVWQGVSSDLQQRLITMYPSTKDYIKDLTKPLIIGHYSKRKIWERVQRSKSKKNGFLYIQYTGLNKIIYLDQDVMRGNDLRVLKLKKGGK